MGVDFTKQQNMQEGGFLINSTEGFEQPVGGDTGINNARNAVKLPFPKTKSQPDTLIDLENTTAVMFIVDSNNIIVHRTNKFWLTGVEESRQEKAQILETFGMPSFFFFGEKVKIYNFSGVLLETGSKNKNKPYENLWSTDFIFGYEHFLRGTKLAEQKNEAILQYKNTRLFGYPLNLTIMHNSASPHTTSFSFSMIVRKQSHILPNVSLNTSKNPGNISSATDTTNEEGRALEEAVVLTASALNGPPSRMQTLHKEVISATEADPSLNATIKKYIKVGATKYAYVTENYAGREMSFFNLGRFMWSGDAKYGGYELPILFEAAYITADATVQYLAALQNNNDAVIVLNTFNKVNQSYV